MKVTALKDKARELSTLIQNSQTTEDLSTITQEFNVVLDQMEIDLPDWFSRFQSARADKLDQLNARSAA